MIKYGVKKNLNGVKMLIRNGGVYIDIQYNGKTYCRKVKSYTYGVFS